jgi:hypothetical protein
MPARLLAPGQTGSAAKNGCLSMSIPVPGSRLSISARPADQFFGDFELWAMEKTRATMTATSTINRIEL